jgi:hypothetical protein
LFFNILLHCDIPASIAQRRGQQILYNHRIRNPKTDDRWLRALPDATFHFGVAGK